MQIGKPAGDITVHRRKRAAKGQGTLLRREILDAAAGILADTGSEDAVSIRAVAERAGVSTPAIYMHFQDKESMIMAVCTEVFDDLDRRLQDASAGLDDPVEVLRQQGIAYVRFALERPEHYRIVFMQRSMHSRATALALDPISTTVFQHLLATVKSCQDAGIFPEGDSVPIALGLWSVAHGLASLIIVKPYMPWPDVEEFADLMLKMARLGMSVFDGASDPSHKSHK
ncbi:MAG: TetR/AcrR family transcriptional regulator [Actinobacteria bacterium]|nr:TetR/AcrR family transcriptional regulator [Actinomycetota bacterium]MCL5446667.1 TetR/AcrR family transcriptional regulator [Actinomycetota bacterium]